MGFPTSLFLCYNFNILKKKVIHLFYDDTTELAQNKLLLLYILEKIDMPMENAQITQFVLENNYMNYFSTQQYLSELIDSKFIEVIYTKNNSKKSYKLSDSGKSTLAYFDNRIPTKMKKEIDSKYEKKKKQLINETQIVSDYYKKSESQYIINLKVIEKDINLFSLSLNVVSNKQAKKICDNWKKNPDQIYQKILDMLVNDETNQ